MDSCFCNNDNKKCNLMKKEEDVFRQFRDSFSKLDGHFHILEQRIPVEVQMEYFKYSEEMRKKEWTPPLTDEESEALYHILQEDDVTELEKKHLLTSLAASKSVKAFRMLEDYAAHSDASISNWAYMALMESRISLESEFSDEKQVYISTGLGGRNEKLRFFILVLSRDKKLFEDYQRKVIEREFTYILPQENCEIERLDVDTQHVEMVFLVPIRADIKGILDKAITECNQYGDFLSPAFTITNVKELSKEEIADIINKDGDT